MFIVAVIGIIMNTYTGLLGNVMDLAAGGIGIIESAGVVVIDKPFPCGGKAYFNIGKIEVKIDLVKVQKFLGFQYIELEEVAADRGAACFARRGHCLVKG